MAKIIGNTTATPNPRPDWNQKDETKADYIKNKIGIENGSASGSVQLNGCTDEENKEILGAVASGIQSVAFGGYRYEKDVTENRDTLRAKGNQSAAFGGSNLADGNYTIVAGKDNKAYQEGSVAFGGGNIAGKAPELDEETGEYLNGSDPALTICASVFGANSKATGKQSFAAGQNAQATGDQSAAFGASAKSSGKASFAAGNDPRANGFSSIALGNTAEANSSGAFAAGASSKAQGISSVAMGHYSEAGTVITETTDDGETVTTYNGDYAIALGYKSKASEISSVAIGSEATASGKKSVAIGDGCKAEGENSVSLGKGSVSNGTASFSAGGTASGTRSVSFGAGTKAEGNYAFASGELCEAKGINSTAIGQSNSTEAQFGVALGRGNKVYADAGIALGDRNEVNSNCGFATGNKNIATGESSVTLGDQNSTNGKAAVALGTKNKAEGTASVALGTGNSATATSTAIGYGNKAPGYISFAGGYYNNATGANSTVFGMNNEAKGARSTIFGFGNSTTAADQFVCGRFATTQPDSKSDAVFVAGFGPVKSKSEFADANATIGYYCIYNGVKTLVTASNCEAIYASVKEYYTHNTVFAALRDGRAKVFADPIYDEDVVSLGYLKTYVAENGGASGGTASGDYVPIDAPLRLNLDDAWWDENWELEVEDIPEVTHIYGQTQTGDAVKIPVNLVGVEYNYENPYAVPVSDVEGYYHFKDPVMDQNPVTLKYFNDNIRSETKGHKVSMRVTKNDSIKYSIYFSAASGIDPIENETDKQTSSTPIEWNNVVAIIIHDYYPFGGGVASTRSVNGVCLINNNDGTKINVGTNSYSYGDIIIPMDDISL